MFCLNTPQKIRPESGSTFIFITLDLDPHDMDAGSKPWLQLVTFTFSVRHKQLDKTVQAIG